MAADDENEVARLQAALAEVKESENLPQIADTDSKTYCNRLGCSCGLPRDESKPMTLPEAVVRGQDRGIGCWPPVNEPEPVMPASTHSTGFGWQTPIQSLAEWEKLSKRYEERLQRQTANMTELIAKYNAVIAVAEELIHDFGPDADDVPADTLYYEEKLEAAKRTSGDG